VSRLSSAKYPYIIQRQFEFYDQPPAHSLTRSLLIWSTQNGSTANFQRRPRTDSCQPYGSFDSYTLLLPNILPSRLSCLKSCCFTCKTASFVAATNAQYCSKSRQSKTHTRTASFSTRETGHATEGHMWIDIESHSSTERSSNVLDALANLPGFIV
jgi:hypothetical protein